MKKDYEEALEQKFVFMQKCRFLTIYDKIGLEVEDGWFPLVFNLCTCIYNLCKRHQYNPEHIYIKRITEKFGLLNFSYYLIKEDEELNIQIKQAVNRAKEQSAHTCQICGDENAKLENLTFSSMTLCKNCFQELQTRKKSDL